jgi:hypothetical protein
MEAVTLEDFIRGPPYSDFEYVFGYPYWIILSFPSDVCS